MLLGYLTGVGGNILTGIVGGAIGAGLSEINRYYWGWRQAGNNMTADFHIAGTMYPEINPANPSHKQYLHAIEEGKTHVQELIWFGGEVALRDFLKNRYLFRQVSAAMSRAEGPGLLMGDMPERVERPLMKKIIGYHNTIPNNTIVNLYKRHMGIAEGERVDGISPPTHEHYPESQHRRVLRAMFVSDQQLDNGLPPIEKIYFHKKTHQGRYKTLQTIIEDYRANKEKYVSTRAFF